MVFGGLFRNAFTVDNFFGLTMFVEAGHTKTVNEGIHHSDHDDQSEND